MSIQGSMRRAITQFPQTHIWVDSCAKNDLEYAIDLGVVGATTNPVIVGQVLKKELPQWEGRICTLVQAKEGFNEEDIAWTIIHEMGLRASQMLLPTFEKHEGRCGRVSMQTNIKNYQNVDKMVAQALEFHQLAANMQVKIPGSPEGIAAMEEITYHGVSINATVVFSVCQAIAVAEAVERGLARRRDEGLSCENIVPVCTIMLGRVDDWLKTVVQSDHLNVSPEALEWAGVAVFKNAYQIFQARGFTTRLLTAAYRNIQHWSAFLGGDVSMTVGTKYLESFDASDVILENTIERPIDSTHLEELLKLKEFRKAYEETGMKLEEFCHYGAFVTCLKGFFAGYDELLQLIRGYVIGKADR